jgi:hypothetical protein
MPMTAISSIASALDLNQVCPLTEEPEIPPPDFGPAFPEPILNQDTRRCAGNEPGPIADPPEVVTEPSTDIRTSPLEPWELSRGAQRLLKLIQKFVGKYGNFYASQCWIGDHLARCTRTVYRWTQELIRNGFLSLRRRAQNTLVYTLLNRKMSDQMSGQVSGQVSGLYKEELNKTYIHTTAASPPGAAATADVCVNNSEPNRKPPRQVSAAVTQLLKELWINHPEAERGSMTYALDQLQVCLANDTDAATLRVRHAQYVSWWAIERAANSSSYIPWLGRFFRDGDWRIAPEQQHKPVQRKSASTRAIDAWAKKWRATA